MARDAPLLAQLNETVHELHVEQHPEVFRTTDPSEVEAWYGRLLEDPAARAWIAFSGDTPVGYVLILERHRPKSPFSWERRWFELNQLCVLPAYRRRGIARALIEEAKRYAARSTAHMTVEAWAFNTSARATFEQLGFAPLNVRFRTTLA